MENMFGRTDIRLPERYKECFHAYCQGSIEGSSNDPEEYPFPRMVDMWFMAVCLAVKEKLSPQLENKEKKYKAIEGNVFGSDDWRSNALVLLAISHSKDVEIVNNPQEMMRVANAYALAGLPRLISILEGRKEDTLLDHLSEFVIEDLLSSAD